MNDNDRVLATETTQAQLPLPRTDLADCARQLAATTG
jgi:hypothetical protein